MKEKSEEKGVIGESKSFTDFQKDKEKKRLLLNDWKVLREFKLRILEVQKAELNFKHQVESLVEKEAMLKSGNISEKDPFGNVKTEDWMRREIEGAKFFVLENELSVLNRKSELQLFLSGMSSSFEEVSAAWERKKKEIVKEGGVWGDPLNFLKGVSN